MKNKLKITGVIPAHLGSIRFKRKILHNILGIPMVEHVRRRALRSGFLDNVYVASGDEEILKKVKDCGGEVIKTFKSHSNGTSRVAESIKEINCSHVVVIQGDEPLIQNDHVKKIVEAINKNPSNHSWNATCNIERAEDLQTKNIVKAAINEENKILYCFRNTPSFCDPKSQFKYIKKVQGLIAFRKDVLIKLAELKAPKCETLESIEQLRIISYGFNLLSVNQINEVPSINEKEDLEKFHEYLIANPTEKEITKKIIEN